MEKHAHNQGYHCGGEEHDRHLPGIDLQRVWLQSSCFLGDIFSATFGKQIADIPAAITVR
jgi:hypothetical protein